MSDDTGQQLLYNIVSGLFPQESVAVDEIELTVNRDNYTVSTNIYTSIAEGESIRVLVSKVENDGAKTAVHTIDVENFNGNQAVDFDIMQGGVYEIEVQKLGADGTVLTSNSVYQAFSYSLEYDPFLADDDNTAHMAEIASAGGGDVIRDAAEVFDGLVSSFFRTYDPRGVLAAIVIIALLLDVAVRKFKFKWPHELIRERKSKKRKNGSA